jgi:long-chain acyl-CoA synthetase
VYGDSLQSWLVAIVVPEMAEVKKWLADQQKETPEDISTILNSSDFHKAILDNFGELAKVNKFSGLEKIKKVYVSSDPFTIENEILTPTMKIKRNIAKDVYKAQIDKMYEGAN